MGNPATLQPKPFTSENQPPAHKKSRKGSPNRATLFKKWASIKVQDQTPAGETQTVTAEESVILAVFKEARKGNVKAQALILDSLYGKVADKSEIDVAGGMQIEVVFTKANGSGEGKNSDQD
jgi:hypothetical protein